MEIISFKIKGKLAHFRKYYANNTAFSFSIPPRTSLMGIVAAVMGWQRDSYYESLASERIHFGVRVLTPLKKSFHRLNLLSVKSIGDLSKKLSSDLRGESGRVQTPFEVVSAWDITKGEVEYQVFISPTDQGESTFSDICNHFMSSGPVFGIALGAANFNASIHSVEHIQAPNISELESDEYIPVHSAIPSEYVDDLKFDKEEYGSYNFVEEDMMPGDFIANKNREVRKMNRLLFSTTPNPLRIKTTKPFLQVQFPSETINIQFMDV